jgi:predicted aldo/keto reductase-like oxidoreductase
MQLGWVLPKLPRDKMIVQTKVNPGDGDPKVFLETFNKSMEYLQLDYVDLLGLHGVNTVEISEDVLRPGGVMDVVRQLQKKAVCASSVSPRMARSRHHKSLLDR